MRGSRNFRRGGGVQVNLTKISDNLFFSPQLILQSQMVNFKENYHFSRFLSLEGVQHFPVGGGGFNFFRGGGSNCLFL